MLLVPAELLGELVSGGFFHSVDNPSTIFPLQDNFVELLRFLFCTIVMVGYERLRKVLSILLTA